MISSYINQNHQSWDKHLEELAFAFRTAKNDTTQYTPAELFLGRKIITPLDKLFFVKGREDEFKLKNMKDLIQDANLNIQKGQQSYSKYYNLRRRPHQYKAGQKVLKETHPISSAADKFVAKLAPKYEGPYTITEVKDNNLKIKNDSEEITINVDQARPYNDRTDMKEYETITTRNRPSKTVKQSSNQAPKTPQTQPSRKQSATKLAKHYETRKAERPYNHKQSSYRKQRTTKFASETRNQIEKPPIQTYKNIRTPQGEKRTHYDTTRFCNKRRKFNSKRLASNVPLPHPRRRKIRNPTDRNLPEETYPKRKLVFRPNLNKNQFRGPQTQNIPIKRQNSANNYPSKQFKPDNKRNTADAWLGEGPDNKKQRVRSVGWKNRPRTYGATEGSSSRAGPRRYGATEGSPSRVDPRTDAGRHERATTTRQAAHYSAWRPARGRHHTQ